MRLPALITGRQLPAIRGKQDDAVLPKGGPPTDARPVIIAGNLVVLAFFGLLGGWAAFAPLSGAVLANGTIRVEGNNKAVQHLDGGIVREILVKDGDEVKQGQLLIRLDDLQARATVQLLKTQYYSTLALMSRLKAERDGLPKMELPPELVERQNEPEVAEVITGQRNLFEGRRRSLEGQTAVLKSRVAQLREQSRGAEIQQRSQDLQLKLIQEELKGAQYLFEQGYGAKTRVLALERAAAQLSGQRGEYGATLARIQQSMGETELQMLQLQKERLSEVIAQLTEAQDRVVGIFERMRAAEDILSRTEIRAPASGVAFGLTAFTVGGVIDRSARILEIVPANQPMIVEANVKPEDISGLREGLPAEVRLTAYKQRDTGIVHGTVTKVSADRITKPPVDPIGYYTITVELSDEWRSMAGVKLVPGMPAMVTIPTKERTVLSYLIGPLFDSLSRGMREN